MVIQQGYGDTTGPREQALDPQSGGRGEHHSDALVERINTVKPTRSRRRRKPAARALTNIFPPKFSRYVVEVEVNCDECGGSGFDPGGIDPWGPEPCRVCRGERKQRIRRNYLAEAFQIAANPESVRPVERQHLIAIIQHCREAVSALVSLPEIA